MSNEHDSQLDERDAIDRLIGDVARTLTASPPRAGLVRRVETRLAGEATRSGFRSWGRSWVLAPAAAACVLLLAVFVARETRESPPPARVAIAPPAQSAPDTVTQERAPRQISGRATRRSPSVAAASAAPPADAVIAPLALPPIATIERIEVAPIARGDQIDISGIAIERIEVPPMP